MKCKLNHHFEQESFNWQIVLILIAAHFDLEDIVLVWQEVLHHVAVLGGGEEARHFVVVGVPREPGLDDELVRALHPGGQAVPAHLHAGQCDLQAWH